MRLKHGVHAAFLAMAISARLAGAASAHVTLESDPGETLLHGASYDLYFDDSSPATDQFHVTAVSSVDEPTHQPFTIGFLLDNDRYSTVGDQLSLSFYSVAPLPPLAVGTYPIAVRIPPPGVNLPWFSLAFDHLEHGDSISSFTIHELVTHPDPVDPTLRIYLDAFSASFETRRTGATAAIRGTINFSAVPEPNLSLVAAVGSALLALARRSRTNCPS